MFSEVPVLASHNAMNASQLKAVYSYLVFIERTVTYAFGRQKRAIHRFSALSELPPIKSQMFDAECAVR